MSTSTTSIPAGPARSGPLTAVGRSAIAIAAYLGGLTLLTFQAFRSLFHLGSDRESQGLFGLINKELGWMFKMGIPLVALMHIGLGSFLAMQAYFGGTFVDGTGAVVGVGLFRNVAPMMTGLTLAALLCAKITPELKLGGLESIADELALPRVKPGNDRLVLSKILGAMVSGFVLTFWACLVGTVIGWRVAYNLMGVSTHSFFVMFRDMIWIDDIVGALLKGLLYGGIAGAIACYEGLRETEGTRLVDIANAAFRAACLSWVAILLVNSGWFLIFYHSGSAFGPTLMAAPTS